MNCLKLIKIWKPEQKVNSVNQLNGFFLCFMNFLLFIFVRLIKLNVELKIDSLIGSIIILIFKILVTYDSYAIQIRDVQTVNQIELVLIELFSPLTINKTIIFSKKNN